MTTVLAFALRYWRPLLILAMAGAVAAYHFQALHGARREAHARGAAEVRAELDRARAEAAEAAAKRQAEQMAANAAARREYAASLAAIGADRDDLAGRLLRTSAERDAARRAAEAAGRSGADVAAALAESEGRAAALAGAVAAYDRSCQADAAQLTALQAQVAGQL